MAKSRLVYVCEDCGSDYSKWQGQCSDCKAWNSIKELSLSRGASSARGASSVTSREGFAGRLQAVRKLDEVELEEKPRISTSYNELDRVLGGGMVEGSAILISGNPGAGKSTLLIQLLCRLASEHKALYVTGEESASQIALRARRLGLPMTELQLMAETNVTRIIETAAALKPAMLVVDSIQVMYLDEVESAPGGVAQVRESASALIRFAKETGTVLVLVGHVTKDGNLAGPRILEHMIDCFVMLEGDDDGRYRTLRSIKNRFGAVNELGVFAMTDRGMLEVSNPSAIFLSRPTDQTSGSVVMVIWEGTRPILLEVQALVDGNLYGQPRRVAVGFDQNRLSMLLAVLHRHGGMQLGDQDVFVNAVGGIRVDETGSDLALLLAIVSSFRNHPLPQDLIVFGELGLSGELRPVPNGQDRLREAAKHGFRRAIVPKGNLPKKPLDGMQILGAATLSEALTHCLALDAG